MPTPSALPPGGPVPEYPQSLVPVGHVEPAPRRVRAFLGGRTVLDTERARYVWEWPPYPQYYQPGDGAAARAPGGVGEPAGRGAGVRRGRSGALRDTVRFEWSAMDTWFEED